MLNGSNFPEWKEHLLLVLALMDLDISLMEERPDADKCVDETKYWDRSNRISMMIMRIRIPPKFRGIIPEDVTTAKEYLAAVEKCYAKHEMSEIGRVTAEFCSKKKANESVREYIMTKMSIAAKIKKLGMHILPSWQICYSIVCPQSMIYLRILITIWKRNGRLMSSSHTVCKKKIE
ncbi:unnamed protein product [Arabis nemorensis]|uniref:Retrotransposon Copia-like N-terminal domain-containing protein n=1 Tax=Arabis nemorensis TaxID=586526 RepID=A0A565CQD2_9BRAS|nr:unnamed protein product [Arabis nemorensis]